LRRRRKLGFRNTYFLTLTCKFSWIWVSLCSNIIECVSNPSAPSRNAISVLRNKVNTRTRDRGKTRGFGQFNHNGIGIYGRLCNGRAPSPLYRREKRGKSVSSLYKRSYFDLRTFRSAEHTRFIRRSDFAIPHKYALTASVTIVIVMLLLPSVTGPTWLSRYMADNKNIAVLA